ncbi:MAG: hypothetical protein HY791_23635 [Deltaproteobacteria bacterium]|nr:hypothetical protein [Deltaproteobacteria bacterium]
MKQLMPAFAVISACSPPVAGLLEMPVLSPDESMILGMHIAGEVSGFAFGANDEALVTRDIPEGESVEAEVWIYEYPLERLELAPGPIVSGLAARSPPAPDHRLAAKLGDEGWSAFTDAVTPPPTWFDQIQIPIACATFSTRALSYDARVHLKMTTDHPPGGALLLLGDDVYSVASKDADLTKLPWAETSTRAVRAIHVSSAKELFLALDGGIYRGEITRGLVHVRDRVSDEIVDWLVFSDERREFYAMKAAEDLVVRIPLGGSAEVVHRFPSSPDPTGGVFPLRDRPGALVIHDLSNEVIVIRDGLARIHEAGDVGVTGVGEILAMGIVAGNGSGAFYRLGDGQAEWIPGSPYAVMVRAVTRFRGGFLAGGASGEIVQYRPETGFCDTIPVHSGVIRHIWPLGDESFVVGGRSSQLDTVSSVEVITADR